MRLRLLYECSKLFIAYCVEQDFMFKNNSSANPPRAIFRVLSLVLAQATMHNI